MDKRKHIRLKEYDYSQDGYYFVTICTENNLPLLAAVKQGSECVLTDIGMVVKQKLFELENRFEHVKVDKYVIMPTHIHVVIILKQLCAAGASPRPTAESGFRRAGACSRRPAPQQKNDIRRAGALLPPDAAPRPTLMDVICAYKSITTRECNRNDGTPGRKLFQTSFYEMVLRDERSYNEICRYIEENPLKERYRLLSVEDAKREDCHRTDG